VKTQVQEGLSFFFTKNILDKFFLFRYLGNYGNDNSFLCKIKKAGKKNDPADFYGNGNWKYNKSFRRKATMADQGEKQRIAEAASKRFFELGVSKVTIDEVAADLGMSKKTIYKFFPSKDDLLLAGVHMNMERIGKEVSTIINSPEPFEKKVAAFLVVVGRQISRISGQFQSDLRRVSPHVWNEIDTFRREVVIAQLKKLFVQAKKEGYFREDLNVEIFQLILVNAAQGIVNPKILAANPFSAVEAYKEIIRVLFTGALTDKGKKHLHLFDSQFEHELSQRMI
jgi:AcrR family transcriptional regulator